MALTSEVWSRLLLKGSDAATDERPDILLKITIGVRRKCRYR